MLACVYVDIKQYFTVFINNLDEVLGVLFRRIRKFELG